MSLGLIGGGIQNAMAGRCWKTLSENLKHLKSQQENTTRRSPRSSPRWGNILKRSKIRKVRRLFARNAIKNDVSMMYLTFGQS